MAQLGRALRSGRRGRKFKSCRLDDPAYWSSGQDAALSRRKPGFDSRIGHIIVRERHCLVRTVPFLRLEIKLKTVDQMLTEISFVSLILLCQIRLVV